MCIYIFAHYWRGHSCGFTESPNDDPPHLHCTSFLKAESFSSSIFTTFLGVARFHEDACACCWKMYLLVKNCSIPVPSSIYLFIDLFIHSFIYLYISHIYMWMIYSPDTAESAAISSDLEAPQQLPAGSYSSQWRPDKENPGSPPVSRSGMTHVAGIFQT